MVGPSDNAACPLLASLRLNTQYVDMSPPRLRY